MLIRTLHHFHDETAATEHFLTIKLHKKKKIKYFILKIKEKAKIRTYFVLYANQKVNYF